MNPIETLAHLIQTRFPNVNSVLDTATTATGSWFLDLALTDHGIIVEWNPIRGFGVTSKRTPGYGEGTDEVFTTVEESFERIVGLFLANAKTSLPEPVRLRELRRLRGLSQEEMAKRLEIKQSAISKLERRSDFRIVTLQKLVRAMGGELIIRAKFPDGERDIRFDDLAPESVQAH